MLKVARDLKSVLVQKSGHTFAELRGFLVQIPFREINTKDELLVKQRIQGQIASYMQT